MYNEADDKKTHKSGIYVIKNIINNKIYVGQTINIIENRIKRHQYELKNNKHANIYLQREFNKFGIHCFEFNILYFGIITIDELNEIEINLIQKYKSNDENFGYNILLGGKNQKLPETVKNKISKSLLNNKFTSKKIVQYDIQTGNILKTWDSFNEIKRQLGFNIGNIAQCCKLNPQYPHSNKFGWRYLDDYEKSNKNDLMYDLNSKKHKKIIAINCDEIIEFKSIKEAEVYFNVHRKFIHRVLSGKRKKYHNYEFKYV
jgi:group I intron endonuclease